MRQRSPTALVAILILAAIAAWVASDSPRPDWVSNLLFWRPAGSRDIKIVQGLDLQGGLEVLLQAVPGEGQTVTGDAIQAARIIVEQRINALGVSEPLVQQVGSDRIAVQLPGVQDPDLAIKTFGETGLLEFVDTASTSLTEGTVISTTGVIADKHVRDRHAGLNGHRGRNALAHRGRNTVPTAVSEPPQQHQPSAQP